MCRTIIHDGKTKSTRKDNIFICSCSAVPLSHVHRPNGMDPRTQIVVTDLIFSVALEEQDIDDAQLAHIAVLLEFLANLGADGGHGHVQRVHGLDLRGL